MSVHRAHKQSDLEKRLKLLNTQLYGKSSVSQRVSESVSQKHTVSATDPLIHRSTDTPIHRSADTTYLGHDLTKIAILSSLAVGVQLVLHFALSNNLLKLPI